MVDGGKNTLPQTDRQIDDKTVTYNELGSRTYYNFSSCTKIQRLSTLKKRSLEN